MNNNMLFFRYKRNNREMPEIDSEFQYYLWRPSFFKVKPKGMSIFPFLIWWMMHHLGFFKCNEYSIFVICQNSRVIHRSCIFPSFFRFPFMKKSDLQIGDIWTDDNYRGKGLASFALHEITKMYNEKYCLWYLTDVDNTASINLALGSGFEKVGSGCKKARFGLKLFGYYTITTREQND